MEAIELKNINKYYGKGTSRVHVLKDVSFRAEKGEFVLILGPSGSGKSTFLTIAGILQKPTSGDVLINGTNTREMPANSKEKLRLNKIGFVLQSHNLVPYLTVSEQFELVDKVKNTENLSQEELAKLLESLEISDLTAKYPNELSGGQMQRAAIARALYANPEIILADEPTAALDTPRVNEVGNLLGSLAHHQNKAVITVTHDLRLLDQADRVYDLDDGRLRER
ncbi:ABC transporter ATP-binding protein [Ligilactobacillus sp.]|uniref:ABC transporter ATP-binding protein n=1 Tax=Ligilactobacillus sp. TaxID=2767921 RepID=UPI002FDF7014